MCFFWELRTLILHLKSIDRGHASHFASDVVPKFKNVTYSEIRSEDIYYQERYYYLKKKDITGCRYKVVFQDRVYSIVIDTDLYSIWHCSENIL